jgi:hypothetical protein
LRKQRQRVYASSREGSCRWGDLNNRPSPFESAALSLSCTGQNKNSNTDWQGIHSLDAATLNASRARPLEL